MDELSQLLSGVRSGSGTSGTTGTSGTSGTAGTAPAGLGGLGGLLGGLGSLGGSGGIGGSGSLGGLGGLLGGSGGSAVPNIGTAGAGGLAGILALLPTLLPSLLGLLGGQSANGASGLHQLVSQLETQGAGQATQSWIGNGPNLAVTAQQVEQALGPDKVGQLAAQTGLPASQVTQGVAAMLPTIVHSLTPNGQLPPASDVQQALGGLLGKL